jgi:LmbE family N-acetylglucosaminyl deacetylase
MTAMTDDPTRSTLVSFHAHPDDECIVAGGTIARAAHDGHRVVLAFATRGELGEVAAGFLDPGESLAQRREREARRAAEILGAAHVEFLGYRDSGMADTDTVDDASSFWSADVDEAASRLAAIVAREQPAVLTTYDERGNYGHPDHVQVHRVALRAAELVPPQRLYAATADREFIREMRRVALEALPDADDVPDPDEIDLGVASERITTRVDVTAFLAQKRAAMRAHASQIDETSVFSALPDDAFARAFGTEWFMRLDETPAAPEGWLFPEPG